MGSETLSTDRLTVPLTRAGKDTLEGQGPFKKRVIWKPREKENAQGLTLVGDEKQAQNAGPGQGQCGKAQYSGQKSPPCSWGWRKEGTGRGLQKARNTQNYRKVCATHFSKNTGKTHAQGLGV